MKSDEIIQSIERTGITGLPRIRVMPDMQPNACFVSFLVSPPFYAVAVSPTLCLAAAKISACLFFCAITPACLARSPSLLVFNSFNSFICNCSSSLGSTVFPCVNRKNSSNISFSPLCFIFMLFVLSTGAGSFDGALSPDVDCVGLGMADVAEDAAKKTVREAGPS